MKNELEPSARDIEIISDNKKVLKLATETLEKLQREIFSKYACFFASKDGFSTQTYLRTKTNAELDFQAEQKKTPSFTKQWAAPSNVPHPELYALLKNWREGVAQTKEVEAYLVLPARSLFELVQHLPVNKAQLKKIHGVGKNRIKEYGEEILMLIQSYCVSNRIELMPVEEPAPPKKKKLDTKKISFELYQLGKNIEEIATERGFQRSTIEGHLAHFISQGELSVFDLVAADDVEKIVQFLAANPETTLSEAREKLDGAYSYGEIKMVMAHVKYDGAF